MASNSPHFRSKLGKVRGLGSAHHGAGHWWLERVTSLVLVPLGLWFAYSLITALHSPNVLNVAEWFASPINALLMVLFIVPMFIHAKLGLEVVIEDYVKCPVGKYGLLMFNSGLCWLCIAVSILAVLKLHLLDVASGMVG